MLGAEAAMNPMANPKLGNLYSRCSFSPATTHSDSAELRSLISSLDNFIGVHRYAAIMFRMSQPLPRLRMNLDFMPSPVEDRPGLLIRDSYQYSDATLIIPPVLVQCLQCFDGQQTSLDLRELLVRITGELDVGAIQQHLIDTLSNAGFLTDDTF